ncbi:DUF1499 domain-containing protein [Jeotgalibacillus proteolyticus]|uniref:DUF1499 domain-containing protein n=1 Tax=Jeotgalibacillus proteolyticus TaxID=2082395 RepID=A0A2S5GFS8_9BACL|nr:DUF1499 domain-containing protein [Jeotgalibacillus proteolyticus]PPA71882.1 DUF1499 domain-containing protein [Jeotgalibacillus proteolyticus]
MSKKNRIRKGRLLALSSKKNSVSTQTDQQDKKMNPLPFKGSLKESHEKIMLILTGKQDAEIRTSAEDYIHAVTKTKVLRFKDDVEFLFDEKNKLIHFRSESRLGSYDFGVNRKRMEKIAEFYLGAD